MCLQIGITAPVRKTIVIARTVENIGDFIGDAKIFTWNPLPTSSAAAGSA